jgi:peptide/nickel transport system substrate-binding protein
MPFFKNLFYAFTKRELTIFLIATGVVVVGVCSLVVIAISQTAVKVPTAGGSYTEGVVGQPEYINPVTAASETDLDIVKMVYSNIPDIADSITSSADGKTWTIHLKPDLHWQDGAQLTSDDVIFTLDSIQNPDAQSPLAANWQGITASRVSELELKFTLPTPYAFFGDDLENLYIIPKHIFDNVPPGNWRFSDYNLKPIGSGPYQFASYDRNQNGFISSYQLTAWKDSFDKQPLISTFAFAFFNNENDLIRAFNGGEVDGFELASPTDIPRISRPYDLASVRTTDYYAVFLNQSANEALQDPAVRAALGMAIDRNALVADALGGNGIPDNGPIPPDAASASSSIATPTTSLELASTTLTAAGWDLGPNGYRGKTVNTSTVPLQITITVPNIDFLVSTADMIQNDWNAIGVSTTIVTDSPDTIMNDVVNDRNYEALLFGNILGPSSDLYSFWDSAERFAPGLNLAAYDNPVVDTLIQAARTSTNIASSTRDLGQAEQKIVADTPAIFLYSTNDLFATGKNVGGVATKTLSDPSDYFRGVPSWYLETTRILK